MSAEPTPTKPGDSNPGSSEPGTSEPDIVRTAEFNPAIKAYYFLYITFVLLVTLAGIPLLLFWFAGLGQYISRRYYENLKCKLTYRHLIFSKGVLFKIEKTIPLENIQDLTFIENPLLKLFGMRILKIETAGQSNPQGSDMKLIGIVDSPDFKQRVLDQRDLMITENKSDKRASETGNEQMIDLMREIKDILAEIRDK